MNPFKHIKFEKAENDGIWVLNNKGTIDGIHYPQDIRNCTGCHVDDADLVLNPNLQGIITSEGDTITMVLVIILSDSALYFASARSTRENA